MVQRRGDLKQSLVQTSQQTYLNQAKAAGEGTSDTQGQTQAQFEQAVAQQKEAAYGAALQDLQTSANAIHALYYYGRRNTDLSGAQTMALNTMTATTNQMLNDQGLAKRQSEVNEWTANNKLDTLFIYQQLLIILCTTIILVYFLKRGLISTTVFFMIVGILALIFIFTIINRAQYTNKLRDTQYWNKRNFEKQTPVSVTACSDE
jgi:hypothetical protein